MEAGGMSDDRTFRDGMRYSFKDTAEETIAVLDTATE